MTSRSSFLALAIGAVLGLVLGLVYAWRIAPVELYNTTPSLLRSDYRHEWIRLAALNYVVDGDLERAQARLEDLPRGDVQTALAALIESYAAQGRTAETMRALSRLAQRLGVQTPAMAVYLGTDSDTPPAPSASPTSSPTATEPPPTAIVLPTPTSTPIPFVSPLPVPSPHRVISQTLVCEGEPPALQVLVRSAREGEDEDDADEGDDALTPTAGVVLWLTWPGGADRAVTGLRPEVDPGYADFTLEADIPYALSVGEPNAPVLSNLMVQPCTDEKSGDGGPGSWRVVVEIAPR